jgi:hypothetical protein
MSFISLGFVGVAWALLGYSLAFSTGNSWIGDLSNALLNGVALDPAARSTNIPHVLCMAYQRRPRPDASRRRSLSALRQLTPVGTTRRGAETAE